MGLLSKLFGGGAGELLKGVKDILDEVITSKEERMQAELKVKSLILDHEAKIQQELTKRHASDMQSDSWLSKNIRPLVLVACFALTFVFAITDGNIGGFEVKEAYQRMIESTLGAAVAFYFVGRTLEKGNKTIQDRINKKDNKTGQTNEQ